MTTEARGGLQGTLKKRHLSMIAIGGVIGAGLFVGSGAVIQTAGPGAVLVYALAGVLVVLVMRMLGEMATALPDTGSFSTYANIAIGRWAGFSIGWLYAWFWVIVLGVEATAGALILNRWVPDVPQWAWALGLMVLLTLTNLVSVKFFAEFEYWFAAIKIAAIVAFLALGCLALGGLLPGVTAPGIDNLVDHGGVFPNGLASIVPALLVVVFSFFGSEIATIAAGESQHPAAAVRTAVRSVIWRILVFYIGSMLIVVALVPWNSASIALSPYVAVIESYGIPWAATVMDLVVLTAVLSCLNSGLYTASRMLFSLARRGDAPAVLGRTTAKGAPRNAVLVSTVVGFITVALNYFSPDTVFLFLLNSSGAIALFVWLAISVSQLRLRRKLVEDGRVIGLKMWAYPYLTWVVIVAIVGLCVAMLVLPATRSQILIGLGLAAIIITIGIFRSRKAARADAELLSIPSGDSTRIRR